MCRNGNFEARTELAMQTVLEARKLVKHYSGVLAVNDVSGAN